MTQDNYNPFQDTPEEVQEEKARANKSTTMTNFFSPKDGNSYTIRVVGERVAFSRYWFPAVSRYATAGNLKDCPVFNHPKKKQLAESAKKAKDLGKEKESKALWREFFQFEPEKAYAINVIDREEHTMKVWKFSKTVKKQLELVVNSVKNPKTKLALDVRTYDLVISKVGKNLNIQAQPVCDLDEADNKLVPYKLDNVVRPTPLETVREYLQGRLPAKKMGVGTELKTPAPIVPQLDLSQEDIDSLGEIDTNDVI